MSDLLKEIVRRKKADLSKILSTSRGEYSDEPRRSLSAALQNNAGRAIIAEIKKGSPSRGIICEDYHPAQIARQYGKGGAVALSILTDEPFFFGKPEHLSQAREVGAPILCKDFFIDPRQVEWARSLGADAILLIMKALSRSQLEELVAATKELEIEALFETHDEAEIEMAQEAGAAIIGVNSRNLDTLEVDLQTAVRLSSRLPDDGISVAESGIKTSEDIELLRKHGFTGFLIGETLMRSSDSEQELRKLLQGLDK